MTKRRRLILWLLGIPVGLMLVLAIVGWAYRDTLEQTLSERVRSYLTEQITEAIQQGAPRSTIRIGISDLRYHVLLQRLTIDDIALEYLDSTMERGHTIRGGISSVSCTGVAPWSVLFGTGMSVGTLRVEGAWVDEKTWEPEAPFSDLDKPARSLHQDTTAPVAALPQVPNVDSLLNRIVVDLLPRGVTPLKISGIEIVGVRLSQRISVGSVTRSLQVRDAGLTVRAIHVDAHQTLGSHVLRDAQLTVEHAERVDPQGFTGALNGLRVAVTEQDSLLELDSVVYLGDTLTTERLYGLRFSFREHCLSIDSLDVRPNGTDADFFRALRYRGDRAIIHATGVVLQDIDLAALTAGSALRVGHVAVREVQADLLSNLAAPKPPIPPHQLMPFEVFRKIPFAVDVDSVTIRNGSLTFGEIHPQNRTPGHLYWDGISVKVAGLSTRDLEGGSPRWITISATGRFMRSAPMHATFRTNIAADRYELEAAGGMGRLDLSRLNTFMPFTDNIRLSGTAQKATFAFTVNGRSARGTVDALYHDLDAELLEARSKKTNILTSIASWAANWLILKNDNESGPDHRIGRISYTTPKNAAIMQTIWFPLRSGLGDLAGIPIKD